MVTVQEPLQDEAGRSGPGDGDARASRPNFFERAKELAASGEFRRIEHVERRLTKEGYEAAFYHLQGSMLRRELNRLIRAARSEP